MRLPDVALAATDGSLVSPGLLRGRAVLFAYPYTGRPGVADPPGWDAIFGAHGSTPQALAYSNFYPEFRKHSVKIFGVSNLTTEWQQEFAARARLSFPLLSDATGTFAAAVPLAHFKAGEKSYYVRRSFLVENGEVVFERVTVIPPETDAEIMLAEIVRRWA